MKWKRNLKYWISGAALTLVAAFLVYLTFILYSDTLIFDDVNTVTTFVIGMLSFLLSVVALVFSVVTYVSIDSVNALSSMEGNVLCNENYNAEYILLVKDYEDCKTQLALQKKLFANIEENFRHNSKTCMLFTDFLQYFLDNLLWFAYIDTKREDYRVAVTRVIDRLEKRYRDFNAISNGNQYVLREHIKLIKNILNYQSVAHEGRELDADGEMLNIRGRMFVNGVSKTIYYDYLGLEYHKKALARIREIVDFADEEFLIANMKKISRHPYSEEERSEINILLEQAQLAFDKAVKSSEDDMLWKGYISFNKARIDLLSYLVNASFPSDSSWQLAMQDAIAARFLVRKTFTPKGEPSSFLQLEFAKEHLYAQGLYLSMLYYRSEDEAERAECRARAEQLKEEILRINTENETIFVRTRKYLNDIT